MSISKIQNQKKEEALREAHEHKHSDAMNPRGGKDHESHKVGDMRRGSSYDSDDKYSMGY